VVIGFTKQEYLVEQLTANDKNKSYSRLFRDKTLFTDWNCLWITWKTVVEENNFRKKELFCNQKQSLVSKELAHFAHNLHRYENCPCGSLEHPNVMQAEDVSEQLAIVEAKILKLEIANNEIAANRKESFQNRK
jgi:exonuclease SbcC